MGFLMYKVIKRFLDILLSSILIILLFPLMIFIGIIIRLDSKGSAIYKQVRTGQYGKKFIIYKFRSMYVDSDVCTRVGNIIRKLSLDELPQLFNILKGEMSFIGPRPWVVGYYKNMNKYEKRRYNVKPGLTGLAQVKGRGNLSIFKKIEYDLYYVKHYSFLLDVKIVFLTIKTIFSFDEVISKQSIDEEIKALKKNKQDRLSYELI